jgi:hypothetical protein
MKVTIENRKILFIHIPKCAGTSIECSLYNQIGEKFPAKTWLMCDFDKLYGVDKQLPLGLRNLNHLTCYKIFKDLKIKNDLDYIFTICRNPYDRFVSLANWIRDGWEKENCEWSKDEKIFINFKNLNELAQHIIYEKSENHMFLPQYKYIEGFEDLVKVHKIEDGMDNIMKKIETDNNFSFAFKRINTNYSSRKTFKMEDIDIPTKQILNSFYKKDFEFFQYTIENVV